MKRIFVLWALACGFLPLAWSQPSGVTAELQLDRTEFLSDEDMQIKVHIENRSGQLLTLGKGDDWISFSVAGDNNNPVSPLGDGSVSNQFQIQSAQAADVTFNLTPFFDFRQPGHYTVKAAFKLPWNQEVNCKPVSFTVIKGLRLDCSPDMAVGVPLPEGVSNTAPVMRRYFLEKVTHASGMKMYFRLTDGSGAKTLRVFPLGPMVSFGQPQAQIDRFSNLHVLNQSGAQSFTYVVLDPHGFILDRQTYEYNETRPELRVNAEGGIFVFGGIRRISTTDIPPGQTSSVALPGTGAVKP
jgi:hypothetical protein